MNLNDFVVLPNNKAKSVKLNARNLQELQMETVTLAQQSKEMEEKLQQLKESMSKEKEERGHSGGVRWKSGQCGSIKSNALIKSLKHTVPKQLSAGKVKIRVLKDEPLTGPPQPSSPFPTGGLQTTRKNRLMGTHCGPCETKPAGLKDLQTHVSTPDVARCFQKQINLRSDPRTFSSPAVAKPMQFRPDPSQVFTVDHGEEKKVEVTEEGQKSSLLKGEYNEEEAARSFQEALRQWRGEKSDLSEAPGSEDPTWTPIRPASVSAMATQADLSPDRGAEGRGRGGRGPVSVEFTENSLTYVDRLLLKKHSRTPLQTYCPPLAFGTDLKSLPDTKTGKETASSLTAREEELRRYCASLFAVPVGRGGTDPQLNTPESCLVIEVMDERDRDMNGVLAAEQRPDNNRKVPTAQQIHRKETAVPQTASSTRGSSRVSCSSPSLAQPSKPSKPKDSQKLHHSKPQSSKEEHSTQSSSSKCKPSTCLTAKTQRTTKTLIKTPTSMSPKPNWTPNFHKSNPDPGSTHLLSSPSQAHSQTEIPRSSYSPVAFPPDVSPSASPGPTLPAEHLSPSIPYSLWSTFTLSPSSSTEGTLLPNVYPSDPLQRGSDSSLLSEQPIFKDASVFTSSSPIPAEHEFTHCMYPPLDVRGEKEEELSIDSGDEMSTDSLGPASHEEDSSDEEAPMNGCLTRGRSSDERGNPAISHTQDPFVPADADREKDLQADEQEQLSEASMVVHNQRAGPGSEKFCDLDGFPPLGLDVNHGHSDTPKLTRRDPLHTRQTSTHGSDPTEVYGLSSSSSSLSTYTEEHLVFRMMKNNHMQPTEIQIHSTRPTRRDGISADELGTSGPGSSKSTLHPGDGGSPDQHEDRGFTRDQADEEVAAQGDRQSVRLLP